MPEGMLLKPASGCRSAKVDSILSGHHLVMLTHPFLWEGLEKKFPIIKKSIFIISLSNAISGVL